MPSHNKISFVIDCYLTDCDSTCDSDNERRQKECYLPIETGRL